MSLQSMLEAQAEIDGVDASKARAKKSAAKIQADAPIKFMQLSKGHELSAAGDIFEMGLNQALGTAKKESGADFSSSKLNKVGGNLDLGKFSLFHFVSFLPDHPTDWLFRPCVC